MSYQYVGEIRMTGFNFAPSGWLLCNGQLLPISQYEALYALILTNYGGDGIQTFGLPDLRSRVPVHQGQGTGLSSYVIGQHAGVESVLLSAAQMPSHTHLVNAVAGGGNSASPSGALPAIESTGTSLDYSTAAAGAQMNASMIAAAGGATPVPVIQPYLCVNFIIAWSGIFPSRS
jgi:microcystin-dependent protein